MADPTPPPRLICFGVFEVDLRTGELRKHGRNIKLHGQPIDVLAMLLERPGEMVTREELQKKLWPQDTFVDFDHSLNTAINKLREALGDSADNPRFVETLPRRGYRFIYPVEPLTPGPSPAGRGGRISDLQPSASGRGEAGKQAVSQPSPLGERVSRLARTGEGARRYSTQWLAALVAVVIVAVAAVLLALNVAGVRDWIVGAGSVPARRRPQGAPLPKIQSIAVLPLENLSRDPEQEYFADGMTDALITNLGQIGALRVISRTTAMHFKGTKKTLPEIALELNVDAVVEGTVQRSGNHVRITAQLIQASPEKHLWADSYERDLRDVLALQGEVARAIANEVRIKVTPQEQARLARARPVNPEAHEAYLKGRFYWNKRTEEGLKKSIDYFQQAIEKDPNYAVAYAGLADSYSVLAEGKWSPPEECYPKARAAALKALEIDDSLAEAHVRLALILRGYDWDWSGAEREYQRGIELNPGYATAHHWYAVFLTSMGRHAEAIAEIRKARELDPLSIRIYANVGLVLYSAREYDQALEELRKVLELDPNDLASNEWLGWVYSQKGMYEEAIAAFRRAQDLSTGGGESPLILAYGYAVAGKRGEALKILAALKNPSRRSYLPPVLVAIVYVGLGDKEEALAWLEKGYAERAASLDYLKVGPMFDPLRSDPRFQDLLRRMNFPD
ncbi:MAG TPA: tetratricopeptide repeat protein, partial [Terriglobia bacterium]|nr:tetratricopeptide repeat protein [Terriglobia bacterium]